MSGASGASAGPAAAISNLQAFRTCRPCSHFQPAASVLEYVHVVIVCSHSEAAGPSLAACLSEPSLPATWLEPLEPLLDLQTGGHTWIMARAYQSLRPTAQTPAVVVLGLHQEMEEIMEVKIRSGSCPITEPAWHSCPLPPQGLLLAM